MDLQRLQLQGQLFSRLHHDSPILVLPNAGDAASARIFEVAGFPAMATTSAGIA
ncbi:MAG TPA: isocitrate lyase/phosphoenolpyruvate mutase family protein, partial [Candidatus Binatia bacterium]|nr:isocitrate lyase/phosphoenolpyruvate mutase family protein [Candidatus Binatia bacterium]